MSCFIVCFSIWLGVILLENEKDYLYSCFSYSEKKYCSIKPVVYETLFDTGI